MKLIELNTRQLKELRMKQWQKQRGVCPVLKQVIHYEDSVMDHKHKTKKETIGEDGKGLLRGVLHFQANAWEGKVSNAFIRTGMHKLEISLPDALRNLANYLADPLMEPKYIHPTEREFKYLKKSDFNKIKKYYFVVYPKRKKFPFKFRKKMKMTKTLKELLQKINKHIDMPSIKTESIFCMACNSNFNVKKKKYKNECPRCSEITYYEPVEKHL